MTSDRARELREALDLFDSGRPYPRDRIADAARTIALPILEADADLLERIAVALLRWRFGEDPTPDWGLDREHREVYWSQAQVVLAALIPAEESR